MIALPAKVDFRPPPFFALEYPAQTLLALVMFCVLIGPVLAEPATAVPGAGASDQQAGPHPDFSPQQVVRIQLAALRGNDDQDHGIGICYRFASPANKQVAGPLPRFARMIEQGPYSLMLRYQEAVFEPLEIEGTMARQTVTLYGGGEALTFTFYLGKQLEGDCRDCWMAESVTTVVPGVAA